MSLIGSIILLLEQVIFIPGLTLWWRGDAVGLELRHRFIDPVTCRECLFNGRRELNHRIINDLIERYNYRTEVFVETFSKLNIDTAGTRRELNMRGLKLLPRLARFLEDAHSGLAVVAAANGVDWRMKWVTGDGLDSIDVGKVIVDESAVNMMRTASSIAIVLDNAGEAVFDVAFALALAARGYEVMLVARSLPYETDVVKSEAEWLVREVSRILGLEGSVRVAGTGSRYPVFARGRVDHRLLEAVGSFDVVLSKGIANYEALIEYCSVDPERVIAALTAKCPPIAGLLSVDLGTPVARAGYGCRSSRT